MQLFRQTLSYNIERAREFLSKVTRDNGSLFLTRLNFIERSPFPSPPQTLLVIFFSLSPVFRLLTLVMTLEII